MAKRAVLTSLCALALVLPPGCTPESPEGGASGETESESPSATADFAPAERPFWRPVVMGTRGMVSAEHPLESQAAVDVLRAGGNAVDAAVAAFYVTGVL